MQGVIRLSNMIEVGSALGGYYWRCCLLKRWRATELPPLTVAGVHWRDTISKICISKIYLLPLVV